MNFGDAVLETGKAVGYASAGTWLIHWLKGRHAVTAAKLTAEEKLRDAFREDREKAMQAATEALDLLEQTRAELAKVREAHVVEKAEYESRLLVERKKNGELEVRIERLEDALRMLRRRFHVPESADPGSGD